MKVLVTGSRGFIGGTFGEVAEREGHDLLGLSRSSQAGPGWRGAHYQADVAQTDLAPVIRDFLPDVILHGAGAASVAGSLRQPLDDLKASLVTWANLLDSVRRSGHRPVVIFPSSAAVYGNPASIPVEEEAPVAPISPYGFHKAACELVAREFCQCFGLPVLVCRLFSVFGAAQKRLLVWELFEQASGPGDLVTIDGTGNESRDYLAGEDLCRAMLRLVPKVNHAGKCLTLNLASGIETKVSELAAQIRDRVSPGKSIHCRGNVRPGDPLRWSADISRLQALLPDWKPRALSEALDQTLKEWKGAHA